MIEFWTPGRPAPQGSKKSYGKGRMVEMSKYVKPWRTAVTLAASQAMAYHGHDLLDGPLRLRVAFYVARPKKPKFDQPATPPDLSKLVRATEDALTGVVWVDDARVTSCLAEKFYAGDRGTGAHITITEIQED